MTRFFSVTTAEAVGLYSKNGISCVVNAPPRRDTMTRTFAGVAVAAVLTITTATSSQVPAVLASAPNLNLYHDGWSTAYRNPFGAVPTGSAVTVRLSGSKVI